MSGQLIFPRAARRVTRSHDASAGPAGSARRLSSTKLGVWLASRSRADAEKGRRNRRVVCNTGESSLTSSKLLEQDEPPSRKVRWTSRDGSNLVMGSQTDKHLHSSSL